MDVTCQKKTIGAINGFNPHTTYLGEIDTRKYRVDWLYEMVMELW